MGANKGWLTIPMSRLVGHRGRIISFEASPRNIRTLTDAVHRHHLLNVEVVSAAVYHETGTTVSLFENSFSNTDSIYFSDGSAGKVDVPTLTLDAYSDFCHARPAFIKMDIEGAEYDALLGAQRLIQTYRPTFVLEIRSSDLRPFHFLRERGYQAINLKTLEPMPTAESFDTNVVIEDILFVHASQSREPLPAPTLEEAPFLPVAPEVQQDGGTTLLRRVPVQPGINAFRLHCSSDRNPEVDFLALSGPRCVVQFRGGYYLVCRPYLSCMIHADAPGTIDLCLTAVDGGVPVEVTRVERRVVPLSAAALDHHTLLNILHPFGLPTDSLADTLTMAVDQGQYRFFEVLREHLASGEPNHPRLLYLTGVESLGRGQPERALDHLDRALTFGFDPHWAHYMRALAFGRLGDKAGKLGAARMARSANPNNPGLNAMLAELEAELVGQPG